jgi:hypothetical protein
MLRRPAQRLLALLNVAEAVQIVITIPGRIMASSAKRHAPNLSTNCEELACSNNLVA